MPSFEIKIIQKYHIEMVSVMRVALASQIRKYMDWSDTMAFAFCTMLAKRNPIARRATMSETAMMEYRYLFFTVRRRMT
jgi:hypothetical protein